MSEQQPLNPPSPSATITLEGIILAAPAAIAPTPVTYGPVEVWAADGEVYFRASATGADSEDPHPLLGRVLLGVQAAVAAATGISVEACPGSWTYRSDGGHSINAGAAALAKVTVTSPATEEARTRGRLVAEAVLSGPDERLAELYEVYLLGLRATQTVAHPVVGLWAFSTIIEEGTTHGSLKRSPQLGDSLRSKGYAIPSNPDRHPARIRTAALHSKPAERPPSRDEVAWFRAVAEAYLWDRAAERRPAPSKRRHD